jgi:predicted MFS family arabinose efflux permease
MTDLAAGAEAEPKPAAPPAVTPVLRVAVVILCGVVIALNVGKMPPALPGLRADLMLGLVAAGLVVSALNVIGATTGGMIGVLIDRWGPRRLVGAALAAAATGNFLGALAPPAAFLIAGRLCEGLAFILVLSAAPVLLGRLAAPRDRGLVMGFWGTFLPVGSAIAIAAAPPLLGLGGWRLIWAVSGGLAAVGLAALWAIEARHPEPPGGGASRLADLARVARSRPIILAGLAFAGFSFSYIAVLSFLPTWLIDAEGLTLKAAAAIAIAYSLGNAVGNVTGGMLLRRGVSAAHLVAAAAAAAGVLSLAIFLPGPPTWARLAAAVAFGSIGGWIPVSVFATAPRLAPEPRLAGSAMGFAVQLLNIGTLMGPVALAAAVDAAGTWTIAPAVVIAGLGASLLAGLGLVRDVAALDRRQPAQQGPRFRGP